MKIRIIETKKRQKTKNINCKCGMLRVRKNKIKIIFFKLLMDEYL